jgi:hypothetical protein
MSSEPAPDPLPHRRPSSGSSIEPLLIVATSLVVAAPFLFGRVPAGHDAYSYLLMLHETVANAREGFFLPAWGGDANAGWGTPALLFYPPMTLWAAAPFVLAGLHGSTALAIVAVLLLAGSGLALRAWLRAAGFGEGALAASLFYVVAPYRLVDLFERSALAENTSFLFAPLLLLAATSRRPSEPRRVALVALATGALVLSNLPQAVLFGLLVAALIPTSVVPSPHRPAMLLGGLLGLAVAAIALVPQALSGRLLRVEQWYGAASRIFRPSANALFDPEAADRIFNVRVSGALLATAALALLAFAGCRPERRRTAIPWLAAIGAGLLLATGPAGLLWEKTPILDRLQFPWRTTGPMTFATAAILVLVPFGRRRALVLLLAAAAAAPFWGRGTIPRRDLRPRTVAEAARAQQLRPEALVATGAETLHPNLENPNLREIWLVPRTVGAMAMADLAGRHSPAFDPIRDRPFALRGEGYARQLSLRRLDRSIRVVLLQPTRLVWHSWCFVGMSGEVDGTPVAVLPEPETGIASIDLPAGRHEVRWRWRPEGALAAGRWISGLALAVALALLLVRSDSGENRGS